MRWVWVAMTGILLWGTGLAAQERPTVEERLIRLEEGQKGLAQRIEDTNRRIEDLRTAINQRFADVDKRFADLTFWLQMTFGAIFATLGVVVLQWVTTVRRTTQVAERLEAHLAETEKDRLLAFQRQEIGVLKERLERVEQALQKG